MKKLASISCMITLVLAVSTISRAGTISTTKSGIISTTKAGVIPTTRMGTIPTTKTTLNSSSGLIPTRTKSNTDQMALMELLWTVLGW
jgi:hypothetical protein